MISELVAPNGARVSLEFGDVIFLEDQKPTDEQITHGEARLVCIQRGDERLTFVTQDGNVVPVTCESLVELLDLLNPHRRTLPAHIFPPDRFSVQSTEHPSRARGTAYVLVRREVFVDDAEAA